MINPKIIKIALDTRNEGLKNIYTHKSMIKNSKCGDIIKVEFNTKLNKIKNLRYETESCIFCQASASLLSKKINVLSINTIKKDVNLFYNIFKNKNTNLPIKYKAFSDVIKKKYNSRVDCIILPFNAIIKALKKNV